VAETAVVIGASSGIGAALAVALASRGYTVGIAAIDLREVAVTREAATGLIAGLGGRRPDRDQRRGRFSRRSTRGGCTRM
jgi:NAD(P)-dependent dehydrogenase (short-subunit alcohol dehydrogenase family)